MLLFIQQVPAVPFQTFTGQIDGTRMSALILDMSRHVSPAYCRPD